MLIDRLAPSSVLRGRRLVALAVALSVVLPAVARAGAEARGGLGHLYLKTYYAASAGDSGFDRSGNEVSLTSTAFLDSVTSAFASDGDYQDTSFGIYAQVGLLPDLDLIVATEWKEIEKSFALGALGFSLPVEQSSSGFTDVNAGLAYQVLADPLPVSVRAIARIPTYETGVKALRLETINSADDEIALGNGTVDLLLGAAVSSGPLVSWMFVDLSASYALADLEQREFSDRIEWEAKVGTSRWGFGVAAPVAGIDSLRNGSAPSTITQDLLFLDPANRVTVLNDQESLNVGGQLWYAWEGLGIQLGYATMVAGSNTTKTDRFEVALFAQR
ncbi:MAG: hypothetical protein IPK07_13525 [Deltaproteobacteria bacterium]|nr:hypothetical protein [Deltaproteobacteria bacterium]